MHIFYNVAFLLTYFVPVHYFSKKFVRLKQAAQANFYGVNKTKLLLFCAY